MSNDDKELIIIGVLVIMFIVAITISAVLIPNHSPPYQQESTPCDTRGGIQSAINSGYVCKDGTMWRQ